MRPPSVTFQIWINNSFYRFEFGTRITIPLEGVMCPNGIRISIGHPVFTSIALFTFTEGWNESIPLLTLIACKRSVVQCLNKNTYLTQPGIARDRP